MSAPDDSPTSDGPARSAGSRVLVVREPGLHLATRALRDAGHDVVAEIDPRENLLGVVERTDPDLVVLELHAPSRAILDQCLALMRLAPRPLALFATSADPDHMADAVRAGVSTYVVGGPTPAGLQPMLEVARARFAEEQALRRSIETLRAQVADVRDIERAKTVLMNRRRIDDAAAQSLLEQYAASRKQSVGEAARSMLAAAALLDS